MKFIHIADTHLGLAAFNKLDATGMNLRERLIYENFLAGIERIIQERPDAVVHAGDLFHTVKPKTRAYTTVLAALDLLQDAGVPLIVIAGNHSMAKTRYTESPFAVLEYHGAEVHAAYRYRYETVEVGDATFHLIPNMLEAADYRRAFDGIERRSGTANVLVTHGLASMLKEHRLHTVAEHEIDAAMIAEEFDYIALGHYHGQVQIADNAWYSGSIEHCTYGERKDRKGALVVDTATGGVEHLDLQKTPMLDLGTIACADLSPEEIADAVAGRVEGVREEHAMCELTLDGMRRESQRQLGRRALAGCAGRLLDLRLRVVAQEEDRRRFAGDDLIGVDYVGEFGRFVQGKNLPKEAEDYVLKAGGEALRRAILRHAEGDDAPA